MRPTDSRPTPADIDAARRNRAIVEGSLDRHVTIITSSGNPMTLNSDQLAVIRGNMPGAAPSFVAPSPTAAVVLHCAWPGCPAGVEKGDDLLDPGFGSAAGKLWCFAHVGDDHLPQLELGVTGTCVVCARMTALWLLDGYQPVCLHDECRRAYLVQHGGTVPPPPERPDLPHVELTGAYARRAAKRAAQDR